MRSASLPYRGVANGVSGLVSRDVSRPLETTKIERIDMREYTLDMEGTRNAESTWRLFRKRNGVCNEDRQRSIDHELYSRLCQAILARNCVRNMRDSIVEMLSLKALNIALNKVLKSKGLI